MRACVAFSQVVFAWEYMAEVESERTVIQVKLSKSNQS